MESNSLKQAQRELDRFLRPLPEWLRELFGTVQYDAALKKLEEAEDPSPEWVAAQLRSLRVKAQTIRAAVSELSDKLTALLNRYIDAGGTDALRIAHAREELLFLQKTLDDQAAQAARLEQLKQSTALLLAQKDQMDALELARLRQKLGNRERQ